MLLLGEEDPTYQQVIWHHPDCREASKHHLLKFGSLYWIDYLGFITEEKLAVVLITPSLGVPNWSVIYIINTAPSTSFLVPFPGREKTSARGVSHAQSFTLFILLYFIFACIVLSKIQKN
jgi:hypothetical protein